MTHALHVVPDGDLIDHLAELGGCPCGPSRQPVVNRAGRRLWVTVHHSLDGRERDDPATTPAEKAQRAMDHLWKEQRNG